MLIYLSTCCLTSLAGIRAWGGQQTAAVGASCWWMEAALLPIPLLGVSVTLPSTRRAAWLLSYVCSFQREVVVLEERGAGWARRGADRFPFLSILTLCKPGPSGPSGR